LCVILFEWLLIRVLVCRERDAADVGSFSAGEGYGRYPWSDR